MAAAAQTNLCTHVRAWAPIGTLQNSSLSVHPAIADGEAVAKSGSHTCRSMTVWGWAYGLRLSQGIAAEHPKLSLQISEELTICQWADTLQPSWQLQYAETAHCGRADILQLIDDSGADMTTICTISRMMVEHDGNDSFIRQRPELVGLWLQVCQAISRRLSWAKLLASTQMCLRWFYAHLSWTRAGLICCGSSTHQSRAC